MNIKQDQNRKDEIVYSITNNDEFLNASGLTAEYRNEDGCGCCWTEYTFEFTCTPTSIKITEKSLCVNDYGGSNESLGRECTTIYQGDCADFLSDHNFEINHKLNENMKYMAECVKYFNNKQK